MIESSLITPTIVWAALALFFFVIEGVATGSFIALFFGTGAFVAAAISSVGGAPEVWQQCALFVAVTFAGALLARKRLRQWAGRQDVEHPVSSLAGSTAHAVTSIAVGQGGTVTLHGTRWSARNVGTLPIEAHQACSVVATQGISLDVTAQAQGK